jgi:hypothetical protein
MLICWSVDGVGGTTTWSTWSGVNAWALAKSPCSIQYESSSVEVASSTRVAGNDPSYRSSTRADLAADSPADGDAALAEQSDREPCTIIGVAEFFTLVIRQVVQMRDVHRNHEMDRDRAGEARVNRLPEPR